MHLSRKEAITFYSSNTNTATTHNLGPFESYTVLPLSVIYGNFFMYSILNFTALTFKAFESYTFFGLAI